MSRCSRMIGVVWFLVLLVPINLAAADTPVPASSLVVVQVCGVPVLKERVTKFLDVAAPDLAKLFPKWIDAELKERFADRDLSVLTANERIYLSVMSFDGLLRGRPPVVLFLPATDYKSFRDKVTTADERKTYVKGKQGYDSIDNAFLVDMTKRGYVAITMDEETANQLAKPYETLGRKVLVDTLVQPFFNSDAAVYVNLKAINADYGEQLQGYVKYLNALLQNGSLGFIPGLDKRQMQVVKTVLEGVTQAIGDGQGLVLGASVRLEGITVYGETVFVAGTETAKQLIAEKPTKLDEIAALPKGNLVYSASRYSPNVGGAFRRLTQEFAAPVDEDRAIAAIAKYDQLFAKAAAQGSVSVGNGPDSSLQLITATEVAALTETHIKIIKNLREGGWYQNIIIKDKLVLKENVQEHQGFTLHQVNVTLDFDASVGSIKDDNLKQATLESMKRLVNEKTVYWFGHDGKRFVQIVAKDWDAAKKLLDTALADKAAVGTQPAFLATRQALPANVTQLLFAEAGPTILALGNYAKSTILTLPAFPGAEVPDFKLPKDPVVSYLGFAVVLKPNSAGFCGFIPAEAVKLARESVVVKDGKNP